MEEQDAYRVSPPHKGGRSLIASNYLADTNTRGVGRALASLFRGAVSKDTVSRVWRKIKGDWEAWNKRDLKTEDIVRLILDGTTVRVPIDRKATRISLLIMVEQWKSVHTTNDIER